MSYQAKDSAVRGRQLKVQRLSIPLTIAAGAATSANDEAAVLFVKTAALDQITTATGALDAGQTVPTFTTPVNATGRFAVLCRIGEQVSKVVSARVMSRTAATLGLSVVTLANTTGVDSVGDKICLDVKMTDNANADISLAGAQDLVLEVAYTVAE